MLNYVVINASRILPGGGTPAINPTPAGWSWLIGTLVRLDTLKGNSYIGITTPSERLWVIAMLIILLPITTICVSVAGFYIWHRQLIRKRHFEVADAALAAFSRTQAALNYAGNPVTFVGEGTSRKRDSAEVTLESKLLDKQFVPVERLRQHHEAFAELERVAFAVDIHFGDDVACQVREPLRAYNRIVVMTALQMGLSGGCKPEVGRKGDYVGSHHLSDELYEAKVAVETALRPYLVAPTLQQFLLLTECRASARRMSARIVSLSRRLSILRRGPAA